MVGFRNGTSPFIEDKCLTSNLDLALTMTLGKLYTTSHLSIFSTTKGKGYKQPISSFLRGNELEQGSDEDLAQEKQGLNSAAAMESPSPENMDRF